MAESITGILSLLILIGAGFFIAGKDWFGEMGRDVVSKFCVRLAIPCYMFCNVLSACESRGKLLDMCHALPAPLANILVCTGIAVILAKAGRFLQGRKGVFINAAAFSNTVIVGFPVIMALLGEAAMPDAMVYYMANTVLFWSLGTWLLRRDAGVREGIQIRKFFSPAIIGLLVGIAVVLSGITLPSFIMSPLTYLKNTVTPLAMIFIGCVIRTNGRKDIRLSRELVWILIFRYVASPALMIAACSRLALPSSMKQVFCIMTVMPAMTQLGIMSKESGSDYGFASVVITVTTALSMVLIPVYMEVFRLLL